MWANIRGKLLGCIVLLVFLTSSYGQRVRMGQPRQEPQLSPEQISAMEKARQEQHYKEMKRDTEKLLELATELKQQVDRSDENTLSLDAVKKAEQIEKLARSIKTHMRGD